MHGIHCKSPCRIAAPPPSPCRATAHRGISHCLHCWHRCCGDSCWYIFRVSRTISWSTALCSIWIREELQPLSHQFNFYGFRKQQIKSSPILHAFAGSDTTSQFHGHAKKSSWEAWMTLPSVTESFLFPTNYPFQPWVWNHLNLLLFSTLLAFCMTMLLHVHGSMLCDGNFFLEMYKRCRNFLQHKKL